MYDATSISKGGAHIQSIAKPTASRAPRRPPRYAPQNARAARIGNAKLPVALLKNANGAARPGSLRHPRATPVAVVGTRDGERSFGTRINPPTASAAASAHARRAVAFSSLHPARAST